MLAARTRMRIKIALKKGAPLINQPPPTLSHQILQVLGHLSVVFGRYWGQAYAILIMKIIAIEVIHVRFPIVAGNVTAIIGAQSVHPVIAITIVSIITTTIIVIGTTIVIGDD